MFRQKLACKFRCKKGLVGMTKRYVGFVVVGEAVTVVDAQVANINGASITILSDATWNLQNGDRGAALAVFHQRCADYLHENEVDIVVVKASALPTGSAKLALLASAEVRGVVIAAAASVSVVKILSKSLISRTFGERKVDEYVKDDDFWNAHTVGGKLRKTSREAAMLIIATKSS
jgi:hypothetical protein